MDEEARLRLLEVRTAMNEMWLICLMTFLARQGKLTRQEWRVFLDIADAPNMSAPTLAGQTEADREAFRRVWDAERLAFAERLRTIGKAGGLND